MPTEEMNPIESKEIRGISLKGLFWLLGCTASIIVSSLTSYNRLNSKIDELKIQKGADDRVYQQQIRVMETQISALQVTIESLRTEVYRNQRAIQENK
jgi:TolA-binding protein